MIMGYTTWFSGSLSFNKEVTDQLKEYINRFSNTRRMPRDNEKIKELYPNWRELCFFGELGNKGEYFAPISKNYGQDYDDESIIDHNGFKDKVHPGLWCQWIINDNNELVWDEGEKFYNYTEWLEYLIKHFFAPLGYLLNGNISWQGEDESDFGTIHVVDNVVEEKFGYHIMSLDEVETEDLIKELGRRGYSVSV